MNQDFQQYCEEKKERFHRILNKTFSNYRNRKSEEVLNEPSEEGSDLQFFPTKLWDAIEYSVLNGGKRLRPILVYATGEALGANLSDLDASALAVEFIHCYSLIHDDLPAMDDDDLRRGKLTCHKAFDEGTAILAGDALQTLAFEILASSEFNPLPATNQIQMITTLAKASGPEGMIAGQALDLTASNSNEANENKRPINLKELANIHHKKTGALITASVHLGAIAANCVDHDILTALKSYARAIGLSFQVQDDILDVIGDVTSLGKNPGQDDLHHKATYPSLMGLEKAREYAYALHLEAEKSLLSIFDKEKAGMLLNLSQLFISRIK